MEIIFLTHFIHFFWAFLDVGCEFQILTTPEISEAIAPISLFFFLLQFFFTLFLFYFFILFGSNKWQY